MNNQIVWLDLPVLDIDRSASFYSAILNGEVTKQAFNGYEFAVLPHAETNVSGCLVKSTKDNLLTKGALIYFNVNGRIKAALKQVPQFGGEIIEPLTAMGPHGFRAVIKDSEGNRIALHSQSED